MTASRFLIFCYAFIFLSWNICTYVHTHNCLKIFSLKQVEISLLGWKGCGWGFPWQTLSSLPHCRQSSLSSHNRVVYTYGPISTFPNVLAYFRSEMQSVEKRQSSLEKEVKQKNIEFGHGSVHLRVWGQHQPGDMATWSPEPSMPCIPSNLPHIPTRQQTHYSLIMYYVYVFVRVGWGCLVRVLTMSAFPPAAECVCLHCCSHCCILILCFNATVYKRWQSIVIGSARLHGQTSNFHFQPTCKQDVARSTK